MQRRDLAKEQKRPFLRCSLKERHMKYVFGNTECEQSKVIQGEHAPLPILANFTPVILPACEAFHPKNAKCSLGASSRVCSFSVLNWILSLAARELFCSLLNH